MFIILNVVFPAILDITQVLVQSNSKWVLQLINGISDKILLQYFSGIVIFTFFITLLLLTVAYSLMKFVLYVKDVELSVETLSRFSSFVTDDSCLLNCHKLPGVSE